MTEIKTFRHPQLRNKPENKRVRQPAHRQVHKPEQKQVVLRQVPKVMPRVDRKAETLALKLVDQMFHPTQAAIFVARPAQRRLALAAGLGLPASALVWVSSRTPAEGLWAAEQAIKSHVGVLAWLPDLHGWAQVAARFLKPGGIFYIVELHPFGMLFDEQSPALRLRRFGPSSRGS